MVGSAVSWTSNAILQRQAPGTLWIAMSAGLGITFTLPLAGMALMYFGGWAFYLFTWVWGIAIPQWMGIPTLL